MNLLNNLRFLTRTRQLNSHFHSASTLALTCAVLVSALSSVALADDPPVTEKEMKPYKTVIPGTTVSYEMVPIPGGTFTMGSPEDEEGRLEDESPQREVKIEPFWMGKHEVTWDEYDIWSFSLDQKIRELRNLEPTEKDKVADAVTRPTPPYTDMTFGFGHDGFPAICMTQLAAKTYCKWLSEKTGEYYRLPTEAEWEYACRAGTKTRYSFGDNADELGDYAWYIENSDDQTQKVGQKKPNPWGLYDMHGNVAEWVLDQYKETYPAHDASQCPLASPLVVATELYPRVVRGGNWDSEPEDCRSASRVGSEEDWKFQDPQIPQSVWYHTDALFVGFRLVRPLKTPSEKERKMLKLDARKVINKR